MAEGEAAAVGAERSIRSCCWCSWPRSDSRQPRAGADVPRHRPAESVLRRLDAEDYRQFTQGPLLGAQVPGSTMLVSTSAMFLVPAGLVALMKPLKFLVT